MAWLVVGRFGKVHGLKGMLKLHSFTQPVENILQYQEWHIKRAGSWERIDVDKVQHQGSHLLVKIKNIDDRNAATTLTNLDIAIQKDKLPDLPEGEFYWHELIGMDVFNTRGIRLGRVEDMLETGANDVLVVSGERQYLIPYLPDQFICRIDLVQQRIDVDWDENF